VVGEGGNLGFTQRGRLEYWGAGGSLNTDAVDNSGGVDTSDHEVNIKILLDRLVKKGVVKGRKERNQVLAEMTDEVAALVLADNDSQALCLTLDGIRSGRRYEEFVALVDDMVGAGILNRADEAVPSRDELLASPEKKRTKMHAFQTVLETDFPDSKSGRPFLEGYFPRRLRESFAEHFESHVLRREIIATGAVNYLVNKAGTSFLARTMAATKAGIGDVVAAYVDVDREAQAQALREAVMTVGYKAVEEEGYLLDIEEALESGVRDRLEGRKSSTATKAVKELRSRLKL
jgi:glutamate dehydrogenase